MKSGTAQRRLRWLTGLGLALTAGTAVMSAGSANASTAPSGYLNVGTWSNGPAMTATLPAPYAGTVTVTGGPDLAPTGGDNATEIVDVDSLAGCLNGHSGTNGEDNIATCKTYTATMTFSTPVQNPVISLDLLGGARGTQDRAKCTVDWTNATFTAVNGVAPSGLTLAAPLDDPRAAWDGTTLSHTDSSVTLCQETGVDFQQIQVPGTVTSISFRYTVRAKTIAWDGTGELRLSEGPGVVTDVYLAPPSTDLAVAKTVTTAPAHVGDPIVYSIKITNNGPDTALAWTMTDPIPSGIANAATTTPGCSIAGGTLTCTGTNGPSGASRTVTLTGTASTTGTIANTATVSTTGRDTNSSNNSSTATVTVLASPVASPWVLGGVVGVAGLGLLGARRRSARTTA